MTDHDPTRTEGEGETLDMPEGLGGLTKGQILGERYQILEMLGRGGMGEVWKAFDLKLRVEVALKALRPEFFKSERRLDMLRQEVRAAREVMSPNVCRIFDLIEIDERELVSMEYVDGATLLGVLHDRGPLELKEAQDIASQFLAGLEAIHKVGLVHRDIKPENIMLTRAGRVVVMDFGLARQETEGSGSVSGTPAYMAPEQAAGQTLDARADVYSAGVVLAEMVSPDGIKSYESRQSIWEGVRSEPAKLPDSPWAPAIKKAVERDRERRYNTAHTLVRALEDVTLRFEGADDLHPYPGLASFTKEDAEYFFGREAEVEQMWRKLEGPPRMLAIMGPSGAGKSSFIAAGLFANAPTTWEIVRSAPGNAAISSLASVVARELAGDPDAVALLPRFDNSDVAVELISRWAGGNSHAMLVVDQFEELFTQNTPDEQRRFADLLRRFVIEADIHVLLSMRDDFAAACNAHESLRPIFQDLTVLDPPSGANLRRAVVQPATKCGYRFEDDDLVDEMLAEVEGERGALPLLAFAAARLWEMRDRDTGFLTRQAYQDIGGVVGALARHAEATIDRIGSEHIGIVRDLFRNLVTAEGTRAVREWNELLSIFRDPHGESPATVLNVLIDARLLTTYEVKEDDSAPNRRVEIIHESLLANWPRLVRWQTQDADSVQLRDQLRQAARTWNEQGRSDDTLWTGSAFREFASWRERYPGGLTDIEEAFARAMTAHAKKRSRRRRIAVAAAFVLLTAILITIGVSRQRAVAAANRAEASKLLAIAQAELPKHRTDALAYTIASLQRYDTAEGRSFALKALWDGPMVTVVDDRGREPWSLAFSNDGTMLAAGDWDGGIRVYQHENTEVTQLSLGHDGIVGYMVFGDDDSFLAASLNDSSRAGAEYRTRIWATGDWSNFASLSGYAIGIVPSPGSINSRRNSVLAVNPELIRFQESQSAKPRMVFRRWSEHGEQSEILGTLPLPRRPSRPSLDPSSELMAALEGNAVRLLRLGSLDEDDGRIIGRLAAPFDRNNFPVFDPTGNLVAACDLDGNVFFWPVNGDGSAPARRMKGPSISQFWSGFSNDGSLFSVVFGPKGVRVWDVVGIPAAEPRVLETRGTQMSGGAFHPLGRFLATSDGGYGVALWDIGSRWCRRIRVNENFVRQIAFSPDSKILYTCDGHDGSLTSWPLSAANLAATKRLVEPSDRWGWGVAVDPNGEFLIHMLRYQSWLRPLRGGDPRLLEDLPSTPFGPRIDPRGRIVAATEWRNGPTTVVIALDPETGEQWKLDPGGTDLVTGIDFGPEGRIFVLIGRELRSWDFRTDGVKTIANQLPPPRGGVEAAHLTVSPDGRRALYVSIDNTVFMVNLGSGTFRAMPYLSPADSVAFDSSGRLAVGGGADGVVRVGGIDGSPPYLMHGHESMVGSVGFSPDGRWLAAADRDGNVRLWPKPDLSKPPLHTIPYDELMATLEGLTNLRALADPDAPNGYRIGAVPGAYFGWADSRGW